MLVQVQATVQLLKKPNRAFGAMFGNSAKRKFDPDKGVSYLSLKLIHVLVHYILLNICFVAIAPEHCNSLLIRL